MGGGKSGKRARNNNNNLNQGNTPKKRSNHTEIVATPLTARSTPESQLSPTMVTLKNRFNIVTEEMSQEEMASIILSLQDQVTSLNKRVADLEDNLIVANSQIAISTNTTTLLKQEIDRMEQYLRRSCIVMNGVPASEDDTAANHYENVTKILDESAPEAIPLLDKTHPIGPIVEGKQTMILRFNKHSVVKSLYTKRKQFQNVTLRPSITKHRARILKACNNKISEEKSLFNKKLNFVFTDIEGKSKSLSKTTPEGSECSYIY